MIRCVNSRLELENSEASFQKGLISCPEGCSIVGEAGRDEIWKRLGFQNDSILGIRLRSLG